MNPLPWEVRSRTGSGPIELPGNRVPAWVGSHRRRDLLSSARFRRRYEKRWLPVEEALPRYYAEIGATLGARFGVAIAIVMVLAALPASIRITSSLAIGAFPRFVLAVLGIHAALLLILAAAHGGARAGHAIGDLVCRRMLRAYGIGIHDEKR